MKIRGISKPINCINVVIIFIRLRFDIRPSLSVGKLLLLLNCMKEILRWCTGLIEVRGTAIAISFTWPLQEYVS